MQFSHSHLMLSTYLYYYKIFTISAASARDAADALGRRAAAVGRGRPAGFGWRRAQCTAVRRSGATFVVRSVHI